MAKAASRYLCRFTSSPPHLLTSSVGLRRDRLRRGTSLRDLPLAVLSRESIGHVDFVLLPTRVVVTGVGRSRLVSIGRLEPLRLLRLRLWSLHDHRLDDVDSLLRDIRRIPGAIGRVDGGHVASIDARPRSEGVPAVVEVTERRI